MKSSKAYYSKQEVIELLKEWTQEINLKLSDDYQELSNNGLVKLKMNMTEQEFLEKQECYGKV